MLPFMCMDVLFRTFLHFSSLLPQTLNTIFGFITTPFGCLVRLMSPILSDAPFYIVSHCTNGDISFLGFYSGGNGILYPLCLFSLCFLFKLSLCLVSPHVMP